MKRTKLIDRLLPDYTNGEENFNMVSHIVGGGLGYYNYRNRPKKYSAFSMICYIGMGWCIIVTIVPCIRL